MLMILVSVCLLAAPVVGATAVPLVTTAASLLWISMAMLIAIVPALRAILTAYDGWYAPMGERDAELEKFEK